MKHISLKDNIVKTVHVLRIVYSISKRFFYTFILHAITTSILPYISLYFSYKIIDALLSGVPQNDVMTLVLWMISLNLIVGIIGRVAHHMNEAYSSELSYNLQSSIAIKTFELDYFQVEDNETMQLIEQAKEGTRGNGGLESFTNSILHGILSSTLSILYGFILLQGLFRSQIQTNPNHLSRIINHPLSGFILIIGLIFPSVLSYITMKRDTKKSYDVMMGNIDGNRKLAYFYQIINNYKYGKDIRLYGMQDMLHEIMTNDKYSVETNWKKYIQFNIKNIILAIFGNKTLLLIAYLYVGIKAYFGLISVGNVIMYVGAITLISSGVTTIIQRYAKVHLFNNYLDNYFIFLQKESTLTYGDVDKIDLKNLSIEFENVTFYYPNHTSPTIDCLSLVIHSQEKHAIVGMNGAGKTTLIKLLCRLYEPSSGTISINNIPIEKYTKRALDQLYAVVFQDFKLFSYSIKDNVASGPSGNTDLVYHTLQQAGFDEQLDKMEQGINSLIYQHNQSSGIEISGGEAQKIAIARALYKDAPIVILDEPTAALDPKSEAEIYEKFQHLVRNKTAIFISHRMSSCKFCDRISVIDKGSIIEKGTHKELLNHKGLYHKMWNAQAKYYQNSNI